MSSGDVILDVVVSVDEYGSSDGLFSGSPRGGWEAMLSANESRPTPSGGTENARREFSIKAQQFPGGSHDSPIDQTKQYRVTITEV